MRMEWRGVSDLERVKKKITRRTFAIQKELYQLLRTGSADEARKLLLVIGCQRSGTTLISETFGKDWNVKIYPEHSALSSKDKIDRLRLNSLASVQKTINNDRFPLIVLKPLVETQNADRLLAFFPGARAVWMYRHYKDVVSSNLNRFGLGNGIKNLRYIVKGDPGNWRSERVPPDVKALVESCFSEAMNPYDAAALFWYVRNRYYFDLHLDDHPRVMKCQYADFVTSPEQVIQSIYLFIGQPYPGNNILRDIHAASIGKGDGVVLSPEVEDLCAKLWYRLKDERSGG